MKDLILALSIFISTIFFSLSTIMGQSTEDTSGYHMIAAVYAVICVLTLLISGQVNKKRASGNTVFSILILTTILFSGFLSGATDNSYYLQFVVFGIPSALVGMYYGRQGSVAYFVKWLDIFFIIIAISIFISFPQFYASRLVGEMYYSQTLSYEASFVLLLDLYLLADKNRSQHFVFTNKKLYKGLCIIIMPLLFLVIVLSGGRGGFITLLVGLLVFPFCHKVPSKKIFGYLLGIVILSLILSPFILKLLGPSVSNFASESFGRIFSYISGGKIDLSQTSGRDEILKKAFVLIDNKPILGYGLFNYIKALGTYPHNIFVEWLLQGGLLLFSVGMIITIVFYKKLINLLRSNTDVVVLFPIFIYPLTELLFSGTWTTNPYLWFSLFFVLNYKSKSIRVKNERSIVINNNVPQQVAD